MKGINIYKIAIIFVFPFLSFHISCRQITPIKKNSAEQLRDE
jgi:hypothetical protein